MDHPDIGAYYPIRCGAQTFRSFRKMPRCRAVLSGVHMSRISCFGMPRSPFAEAQSTLPGSWTQISTTRSHDRRANTVLVDLARCVFAQAQR
jgi:hypothetical protein